MADNNNFQSTVESLFKGMDSFLTTKTVIGEPIHIGENILLPLADVSFGVAAGAFAEQRQEQRRRRHGREDHAQRDSGHQ